MKSRASAKPHFLFSFLKGGGLPRFLELNSTVENFLPMLGVDEVLLSEVPLAELLSMKRETVFCKQVPVAHNHPAY